MIMYPANNNPHFRAEEGKGEDSLRWGILKKEICVLITSISTSDDDHCRSGLVRTKAIEYYWHTYPVLRYRKCDRTFGVFAGVACRRNWSSAPNSPRQCGERSSCTLKFVNSLNRDARPFISRVAAKGR
jgi:hypothetical protein